MDALKIGPTEIVWSASDMSCIFLDLFIYFGLGNRLEYRPYRKALNHFERIPWISHHPLDVKRGTFIGEITRLAALSSTTTSYDEACREVIEIYCSRGYPRSVVNTWMSKYKNERYKTRLDESRSKETEPVHVLKTVFNPVWEYIDVSKIQSAIQTEWDREIESLHDAEMFPPALSGLTSRHTLDSYGFKPTPKPRGVKRRRANVSLMDRSLVVTVDSDSDADAQDGLPQGTEPEAPLEEGEIAEPNPRDAVTSLLSQKLITSRKRVKALGDLANVWRRTVLAFENDTEINPSVLESWHDVEIWRRPRPALGAPGGSQEFELSD